MKIFKPRPGKFAGCLASVWALLSDEKEERAPRLARIDGARYQQIVSYLEFGSDLPQKLVGRPSNKSRSRAALVVFGSAVD
ncbi:MAG: hypothetical protein AcusKO_02990 [Acuticoccus sp.]